MKVQTEEAIVIQLASQIAQLESVLAEAKQVLQRKTTAVGEANTSPVIYRRLRVTLPNGTPDNLNCITLAFRINYAQNMLQAGWSVASSENVDLNVGRTLAAKRLDDAPLEMPHFSTLSLVDNVFVYFYGVDANRMLSNNEFYRAILRKLRAHQLLLSARSTGPLTHL